MINDVRNTMLNKLNSFYDDKTNVYSDNVDSLIKSTYSGNELLIESNKTIEDINNNKIRDYSKNGINIDCRIDTFICNKLDLPG